MPVQRKGMRALQIWVSRVTSSYSSIEITDLTTSFRNGLAFVGIIHHFRPDLITSPDKLDPDDVMGNNDLAYKVNIRYRFWKKQNINKLYSFKPELDVTIQKNDVKKDIECKKNLVLSSSHHGFTNYQIYQPMKLTLIENKLIKYQQNIDNSWICETDNLPASST